MKSLNFNKLNLQKEDSLSKTQMKQILGGHAEIVDGCLNKYDYGCSLSPNPDEDLKCCQGLVCQMNASNSGTICV